MAKNETIRVPRTIYFGCGEVTCTVPLLAVDDINGNWSLLISAAICHGRDQKHKSYSVCDTCVKKV